MKKLLLFLFIISGIVGVLPAWAVDTNTLLVLNIGSSAFATGGASATYSGIMGDISGGASGTESGRETRFRTGGVLSKLTVRVPTNTLNTGSATVQLRVNDANGNEVVTISASSTGVFQDLTDVDGISAGQDVDLKYTNTGSSGSVVGSAITTIFTPASFVTKLGVWYAANTIGASATDYFPAIGTVASTTIEAKAQLKARTAGTWQNLFIKVTANTRADTTTFQTRINGGNGNQTISIGTNATGTFEDTTHTDTIASGNLLDYVLTTGGGAGSLTFYSLGSELANTVQQSEFMYAIPGGFGIALSNTKYFTIMGGSSPSSASETNYQAYNLISLKFSNLRCYISTNSVTSASTLTFRKNGTNGNESVSITASTTGWFEDSVNTDTTLPSDLINTQLVTGGSGIVMTVNTIAITATNNANPTFGNANFMPM